jgi:hypothetical protein
MEEKSVNGTRISFGVNACPMRTYVQFDEETKKNYGDCRWMYIQHLMEIEELYDVLIGKISEIESRLSELESADEQQDNTQEEPRTGLGSLIER